MANVLTTPKVLTLDTAAVISATLQYEIKLIRLVPAAAAATASFKDGAGRLIARMAAAANGNADPAVFNPPLKVTGLELATITGAGAAIDVYCE